jgi:hypothetical protein
MVTADRVCMTCARAYPGAQTCPRHPDEVLLDPTRQDVLDLMEAEDRGRDERTYARWQTLGGFVGVPLACAVGYALAPRLSAMYGLSFILGDRAVAYMIFACIGVAAAAGAFVARRLHRPRFRRVAGGRRPRRALTGTPATRSIP